ncbi:Importin-5 [Wickerhamomyces ciferrii]|uniref:Importin-5 n=1 Tax=Wickerhamomyces ciferrii (strain ATCC 14091 / BCRC 22168 / CBS 111 / JCM 3599 / NBRC 0793 / NRRL Y-1031 F-60-10) TaxID=1206466 RepID=K0KXE3_WICCF|nr:Importin-5 [Wickerhamomyces ciferrii]CCH46149.1 Importin-5 [Wickerhamomyces ciferrii]
MSSLPTDINAALIELLSGLSSADNNVRSQAENTLYTSWTVKDRVDVLLVFLAEQATAGGSDEAKAFSSVLFRRLAIRSPQNLKSVTERTISTVNSHALEQIRALFLKGFISQQQNFVRHKLADVIAELAKDDIPGEWTQLFPTLIEAAKNPDPSFRESAFRIFATTPALVDRSYINDVLPIYHSGFDDENDDVRIAACTAFVAFFQNLPKKSWPSVESLLPNLLNSLPRLLQNGKDTALAAVLESLIELVELAPKMFKNMFETIIQFCSAVSKNKDLDSSARLAALELLTTFSESSPNMCKRQPEYTQAIVVITLSLMTEVCIDDDDAAEWNNSDNTEDDEEEPEYDSGRQALDRVALRLGGESLASPLFQLIPPMLASADWRERQAALMALSSAAEGCRDVLIGEIPRILDMIIPALNDQHPRVQYACCNSLGQVSTDFADVIQRSSGDRIIPALVSKLTNQSVPRVQAHAAAALVNFSENASKETLEPYLDELLSNLLTLLQSPKRYVQEQVLTTIAIVADAAEQTFIKYYDTLMPLLLNVLKTDMGDENRLLKAKCIECSTLIALAVGKEKFQQHSNEVIQLFGTIQQSELQDDDPVKPYLEQGWGRIARIIGKDFLPFLPSVLPPLLQAASAQQDISLLEEEEAEEFNQDDDWDVIQLAGKHIAVHTALLDDKAAAIDLISGYAEILKGDFFQFTKQIVAEISLPAIDFYLHDQVRSAAASSLPALLMTSKYATGEKSTQTLELWQLISDKLIKAIGTEPVQDLLFIYYTAFADCVQLIGDDALSTTQLENFAKNVNEGLKEMYDRIKEQEGQDDEYNEELDEEDRDYTDEELSDEINKVISVVFKSSKTAFLQPFQTLVPTIAAYINDTNVTAKLFGLCVAADLIEYTGEHSKVYQELFLSPVGESLSSQHSSIRQAAAYAVGVTAQHASTAYHDFILAALEPLYNSTQIADARSEDNINATENASAAISKILHTIPSTVDVAAESWIKTLPILHDKEAAPYAYRFLAQLIESGHSSVQSQVPHVIDSVVQALVYASIGGKTAETVAASTKKLLSSIPHSDAVSLLQKYPAEAQPVIQKWFS